MNGCSEGREERAGARFQLMKEMIQTHAGSIKSCNMHHFQLPPSGQRFRVSLPDKNIHKDLLPSNI
jgi:hypothetical protein